MNDRIERDASLIEAEVRREPDLGAQIDRLYRQHHRAVFRLALRYGLGDEAWAEDIMQDVFITLFDELATLDDHQRLEGWLYRVTTNRCLRKLRREQFMQRPLVRWLLAGEASGSLEQQVYEQATMNNLVDTALKALVEAAVDRVQVQAPMASGVASALMGFLQPLVNAADQLGLDDKIMELASSRGLDSA